MILRILKKIFGVKGPGLKKLKEDKRDLGFSVSKIFGYSYTPMHTEKILELPYSAKNQRFNTCGWVSSTGAKEYDEQCELDERSLIIFGKELGLISGDGYSNLRDNERVLKEVGVAEKGFLTQDNGSWSDYSSIGHITKKLKDNAALHKTKSYSRIYNVLEIYKAIDDGRPVKIGVSWRTSMNMSGGFSIPWILNFIRGILIGGHAMYVYGYNLKYNGDKCFKIRNSFSNSYGDNGDCWITEADMQREINKYGSYVNYDIEKDMLLWIAQHNNKIVKSDKSPDVYLIENGKKRKYTDLATLYVWGKHDEDIITVGDDYLMEVADGDPITFWASPNVKMVKAIIQQKENLKPIFSKYFTELFK